MSTFHKGIREFFQIIFQLPIVYNLIDYKNIPNEMKLRKVGTIVDICNCR